MHAYRIYFMDGRSIIAADMIEATSDSEAAQSALRGIAAYPWSRRLMPTGIEVWSGATLHQAAAIA
jgi:hypothetical protein